MEKLVLNIRELAQTLGISKSNAYLLCRRPGFPAVRVTEKKIVIPMAELQEWLRSQAAGKD